MIRLEKKEEYQKVENLVRESFWNVYRPGCLEHYVLHQLRNDPAFVPELDFVMLLNENDEEGKLIGQNMFMRTSIRADDGRNIPIMTMGPICITPELKRQGYGKILLDYSLDKAAKLGCGAVCFEGNIDFYGKSGFRPASEFNIRYHGLPDGDDDDKIRLNQRKPSKYKGLSRFGPEKNLQRINKFMKERPIFYKNLIQMKENFRFYLRCFYCITKVVILQFNSENRTELARNG